MQARKLVTLSGTLMIAACLMTPIPAQDASPVVPGEVQGIGHHFAVTDSDYLNVTLDSSEEVDVLLHSMGQTILIAISSVSGATSTELRLGGLAPSTTYFLSAGGPDQETFTSDANGVHVFTQDLTRPRLLTIRTTSDTYYISSWRNDCHLFGVWDAATRTCTVTRDLTDWIYLYEMPGTTVDGNGYRITRPDFYAVRIGECDDCTVRNFDMDAYYGPVVWTSQRVTIADNTIRADYHGLHAAHTGFLTVRGNSWIGRDPSHRLVFLRYSREADVVDNSAVGFREGIDLYGTADSRIYHNNFEELEFPVLGHERSYGNDFDRPSPDGGNWWSRHDDPAEGCFDTDRDWCCDDRYELGAGVYDDLPWLDRDGWTKHPPVAVAGPDRTLEATCENSDRTSPVTLSGAGSGDPDGDPLTFRWEGPTCPTTYGEDVIVDLDLGVHTITLTVDDGTGRDDSDDVVITLQDTTAPAVIAPASMDVLCTRVSAGGRGECPADDPGVADWLASVVLHEACDPAPAVTDDCPPVLGVNETTITFTATDFEGNSGRDSAVVHVFYGWGGFMPPLFNGSEASFKQRRGGRRIPVKFSLDCETVPVSAAVATIAVHDVLGGPDLVGGIGNLFRYDPVAEHYIYNLSTKDYPYPASYRIRVTLDDGTVHETGFSLR